MRAAEDGEQCGVALGRPVHAEDRRTNRVAGERRAGQRRVGQRHRGARAETHADPVGESRRGVLLVHECRDPEHTRRGHARQRRVAAEADHDTRPVPPHEAERSHERDERAPDRLDVRPREPALEPAARQQIDGEPGGGNDVALDPARTPDETQRRGLVPATHQLLRDGDGRIGVAARAAPGEQRVDPLGHRLACSAGTAGRFLRSGGVCRATFARIPAPIIVITSDEPPADRNGSVMPDTGSMPMTAPRLITAWPTIHAVTPAANEHAERIGRAAGDAEADETERREQREHQDASDETELLADDREDEVGVGVGEEHPLGATRAEPDAAHAAAAERDQRLGDLIAGVRLVLPRVHEREHAGAAVRRREREHGDERRPRSRRATRDAGAAHRSRSAARTR